MENSCDDLLIADWLGHGYYKHHVVHFVLINFPGTTDVYVSILCGGREVFKPQTFG